MNKSLTLLEKSFDEEVRSKLYKYSLITSFGIFICMILLLPQVKSTSQGLMIWLLAVGGNYLIRYLIEKQNGKEQLKIAKQRAVGSIKLTNNELLIDFKQNQRIIKKGTDISLKFDYLGYRGLGFRKHTSEYFGTTNYLTVGTNAAEKIYVYLHDKEDLNIYNDIIMWCYENEIQITEYYQTERTYGGKKLKYREIQEFKEKYYKK